MKTQDEAWSAVPDSALRGYEVSTAGRVRSWMHGTHNKPYPYIHQGRRNGSGDIVYDLAGEPYTIDELMRWTYGDEAEDYQLGHEPGEQERDLSPYERSEIVLLEGHKPAYEVAEEFRTNSGRVRAIWNGTE